MLGMGEAQAGKLETGLLLIGNFTRSIFFQASDQRRMEFLYTLLAQAQLKLDIESKSTPRSRCVGDTRPSSSPSFSLLESQGKEKGGNFSASSFLTS